MTLSSHLALIGVLSDAQSILKVFDWGGDSLVCLCTSVPTCKFYIHQSVVFITKYTCQFGLFIITIHLN